MDTTTPTPMYSDRPHDLRMAFIYHLREICEHIAFCYSGNGITLTIPRGKDVQVVQAARRYGLRDVHSHYFPLGSDNPPEIMRHDASYPGSRGFWLYIHFIEVA